MRNSRMGWIVIIVLSIVVVAGIAIKLYVSRTGGANISQVQLQEWMEQKSDLCILDVCSVHEYTGQIKSCIF